MDFTMNRVKQVANRAALAAGKKLLKDFRKFDRSFVKLKDHHEILTSSDLASEKIIISEIRRFFPSHQILSEELGKSGEDSPFLWIVDPLDGTTNFSMHNPMWAVSIALAYEGEIILGAVYAPFLNEFFMAEKGKDARINKEKIKVSSFSSGKVLHTFCHGSTKKDKKRAMSYYSAQKFAGLDCRQLGSASLELAFVAAGRVESIFIPGANSYDVAAGSILVKQAGGKVTDEKGRDWNLDSQDILASNGKVHGDALEIIKKL